MPTKNFLERVESYINRHREEFGRRELAECVCYMKIILPPRLLDERFQQIKQTFPQYLLQFIAERGQSEVDVYKRAHLDRRIFSKLRNGTDYMPSKRTVLLIAFALELSLPEAIHLLSRAGYSLSEHSRKDVIIKFFFENQIYDLFLLDETLDHYGFKPLSG